MNTNSIVIELIVDDKGTVKIKQFGDETKKTIKDSESGLSSLREGWIATTAKITAFTAAAYAAKRMIYDTAKEIASATNDIERQANILGISIDEFQKWQYAAKMSDVNAQELAIGIKLLSRNMEDAATGSGDASKYFSAMGISVKDSSGNLRPLDNIMGDIMDKFAQWEDGPRKIAIALQLFGRSGETLIPLLNKGRSGFAELAAEAQKLGIILDPGLIKAGSQAEDVFKRLESQARATKLSFAPVVKEIAYGVEDILKNFNRLDQWLKEHKTRDVIPGWNDFENWLRANSIEAWKVKLGVKKPDWSKFYEWGGVGLEKPPEIRKEYELPKMPPDMWNYFKTASGYIELITTKWEETFEPIHNVKGEIIGFQKVLQEISEKEIESVDQLNNRLKIEIELREQLMDLAPKLDRWELEAGYGPPSGYVRDVGGGLISMADAVERNKVLEDFKNIQRAIIDDWEFQGTEPVGQISARGRAEEAFKKAEEIDKFWANTATSMGQSFMSGFFNIFTNGLNNAGDAFKQFGMNLINSFSNVVQQLISNWLVFGSIMGSSGYTTGQKFGGILGLLNIFQAQEGFSGYVNQPTGFIAGEKGREFVSITPESKMGRVSEQPVINYYNYDNSTRINQVHTNDADSFEQKFGPSVLNVVQKNKRLKGIMSR